MRTWLYANLGGLGYARMRCRSRAAPFFRRDEIKERLTIRRLLAGRVDRSPGSILKKHVREMTA